MSDFLFSVLSGIALSILFAGAQWLTWQSMKKKTILNAGSFTSKWGNSIAIILALIGLACVIYIGFTLKWWLLVTVIIAWLLGGWIATLIERAMYGKKEEIDFIVFAIENQAKSSGFNEAMITNLYSKWVPNWWIKLMTSSFQRELKLRISKIIKTSSTD
jgi:hypothetical protein